MSEFEPTIIGFFCRWCTQAAADAAGTSRIPLPHNLRPVTVNCTGSIDAVYIIQTLLDGADGVLVGGCHPGDCHYIVGNYRARRRIAQLKKILETLGLQPERLSLCWIGASEATLFATTVANFVQKIKELGPNPMKEVFVEGG